MSAWPSDDALVGALRSGDEAAFQHLLTTWSRSMLRLARSFVSTEASAEEVVQDTWLAVLQGIDRFEGRCTLRTWVYRILVNTAKKRAVREHRTVPLTALSSYDDQGPTVDPGAFRGPDEQYTGGWRVFPTPWHGSDAEESTEQKILTGEVRGQLRAALDALPDRQRVVVTLRDVLGHSSDEVCEMLDLTMANQRVLLHRGRARMRALLDVYLTGSHEPAPVEG